MKKVYSGVLIAVEGTDGTGKSTQVELLTRRLREMGLAVQKTREPTNGPYGQKIRELYSNRSRFTPEDELALFTSDRRRHVAETIMPALLDGKIVITDRYYYSTAAYQGARGLDPEEIIRMNETFAPRPDLVVLLFLPAHASLHRIRTMRQEEPNDFENAASLDVVADIFARLPGEIIKPIDASGSIDQVHERIMDEVRKTLAALHRSLNGSWMRCEKPWQPCTGR